MDHYTKALITTHVRVDAGGRAYFKDQPLEVHVSGGIKKVLVPGLQHLLSFDDLKQLGATVQVQTLFSLAIAGAEGRWRENISERRDRGIPSNVYVANARTIERALAAGKAAPAVTWIGRRGKQCTEVRATIDEVVDDLANNRWRKEFSRGSKARKN
jgi:hypothetical protein